MQDFTLTTCFSINPEVAYTQIDDEAVLMGTTDDALYGVNPVGTEILNLLSQQPMTLVSLKDQLLRQFQVEEPQCLADTRYFLNTLLTAGVIRVS